jgi:hypothetical protein
MERRRNAILSDGNNRRHFFESMMTLAKNRLVDMILDKAGSKGTGKWTSQDAMDLPVSVPTIDIAVALRDLSGYKDERLNCQLHCTNLIIKPLKQKDKTIQQLHDALCWQSTIICYAQGLAMLAKASTYLANGYSIESMWSASGGVDVSYAPRCWSCLLLLLKGTKQLEQYFIEQENRFDGTKRKIPALKKNDSAGSGIQNTCNRSHECIRLF